MCSGMAQDPLRSVTRDRFPSGMLKQMRSAPGQNTAPLVIHPALQAALDAADANPEPVDEFDLASRLNAALVAGGRPLRAGGGHGAAPRPGSHCRISLNRLAVPHSEESPVRPGASCDTPLAGRRSRKTLSLELGSKFQLLEHCGGRECGPPLLSSAEPSGLSPNCRSGPSIYRLHGVAEDVFRNRRA